MLFFSLSFSLSLFLFLSFSSSFYPFLIPPQRTLNISLLQRATCGQQIHNEAAIFAWPGTIKSGFGKAEGQLILRFRFSSFILDSFLLLSTVSNNHHSYHLFTTARAMSHLSKKRWLRGRALLLMLGMKRPLFP